MSKKIIVGLEYGKFGDESYHSTCVSWETISVESEYQGKGNWKKVTSRSYGIFRHQMWVSWPSDTSRTLGRSLKLITAHKKRAIATEELPMSDESEPKMKKVQGQLLYDVRYGETTFQHCTLH